METLDNDILEPHVSYETASKGTRFANYIVDLIVLIALNFGITFLLVFAGIPFYFPIAGDYIFGFIVGTLYYTLMESAFDKSLGKFLTGTKVIKTNGDKPSFVNYLGRSAARSIPFNALVFLFSDSIWHDSLSNTRVVHEKKIVND